LPLLKFQPSYKLVPSIYFLNNPFESIVLETLWCLACAVSTFALSEFIFQFGKQIILFVTNKLCTEDRNKRRTFVKAVTNSRRLQKVGKILIGWTIFGSSCNNLPVLCGTGYTCFKYIRSKLLKKNTNLINNWREVMI